MRIENPTRLGGLAALLAGVLLFISELLRLYFELDPGAFGGFFIVDGWVGAFLAVVVQLGLVGIYVARARVLGPLGIVGFVLAAAGVQLSMGASFLYPYIRSGLMPWEGYEYFEESVNTVLFALTFVLGWILLGVAMLRGRAYPRLAAALLVLGALILLIPLPLDGIIFAGVVAWLGYILFMGEGQEVPSPVRA